MFERTERKANQMLRFIRKEMNIKRENICLQTHSLLTSEISHAVQDLHLKQNVVEKTKVSGMVSVALLQKLGFFSLENRRLKTEFSNRSTKFMSSLKAYTLSAYTRSTKLQLKLVSVRSKTTKEGRFCSPWIVILLTQVCSDCKKFSKVSLRSNLVKLSKHTTPQNTTSEI